MGGSGGLERTYLWQFPCWEGVVGLKELIFDSFSVAWVWPLDFNSFYVGRV